MSVVGSGRSDDTHSTYIGSPHKPIGRDAQGYVHHADEKRGFVYQIRDGDVKGKVNINEHPDPQMRHLDSYVDYVAQNRGWADRVLIKTSEVFGDEF